MSRILKPTEDAPICKKGPIYEQPDPAVKIDTTKGKIAEERKKRLEEAKNKPDSEYLELFETVKQLIINQEFWELPPDDSITKAYAFITIEMKKRGIPTPKLPDMPASKIIT